MINEDNIYFDEEFPDGIKDKLYSIILNRLSQLDIPADKVVYIVPMSALNVLGKVFFKTYILNSYDEKYDLEGKYNFLFFIDSY